MTTFIKPIWGLFVCILLLSACQSNKEWTYLKTIDLADSTPIGLTAYQGNIWIADGDHNRLVELDKEGNIKNKLEGWERPMHLDSDAQTLYIPEYGSDKIIQWNNGQKSFMSITDSLDAPAGISVYKNEKAIADFYNHRILYFNGTKWISFGKEGKAQGDLYYPTDVQITTSKIYVADAYNNRVQVFDKTGKALQVIGQTERMNAATGIYVSNKQVFVTDFENDRVLIYDLEGNLQQSINQGLNKPTDLLIIEKELYIANYKGKNLMVYQR